MTKEEADAKLALLNLTYPVTTSYEPNEDDVPYLWFEYQNTHGNVVTFGIPVNATFTNLTNLAMNLPMPNENRLAAAALLVAPLPVGGL